MKYLPAFLFVLLISSCNSKKPDIAYELTNEAIDSIVATNKIIVQMNSNQIAFDRELYTKTDIDRYAFVRIYQAAIRKIADSAKREALITRYRSEVSIEPNWLVPECVKLRDSAMGKWQ